MLQLSYHWALLGGPDIPIEKRRSVLIVHNALIKSVWVPSKFPNRGIERSDTVKVVWDVQAETIHVVNNSWLYTGFYVAQQKWVPVPKTFHYKFGDGLHMWAPVHQFKYELSPNVANVKREYFLRAWSRFEDHNPDAHKLIDILRSYVLE